MRPSLKEANMDLKSNLHCFSSMQLKRSDSEVWSRALSDGGVAVLLLNRNPSEAQEIEADFNLVCIF